MEVNHQLFTLLTYIFNSCYATILVKFGRLPLHYIKNLENGSQLPDPLAEFDLRARQLLCDSVISARQFILFYHSSYYLSEINPHRPRLHIRWGLPTAFADTTWNYQRLSHANPSTLEYKLEQLQFARKYVKIKSLCCVYTKMVKWYLTFGLVDHTMYLLERNENRIHPGLLFTGILEPSALIQQKSLIYFCSQLATGKSKMESLCEISEGDKLRVCSAIYDALDMGSGARQNYHMKPSQNHTVRKLHSRYKDPRKFKFLQCNFFEPERGSESFFALADTCEQSAVFVFFEDEDRKTVVEMIRVAKIGALLNPLGKDIRRQKTKALDEDFLTLDPDDESPKRKKRKGNWQEREDICTQALQNEADIAESSQEHRQVIQLSNIGEQLHVKQKFTPTTSLSCSRELRDKGCETDSEGPPEENEPLSSKPKRQAYKKRKRSKFKKLSDIL